MEPRDLVSQARELAKQPGRQTAALNLALQAVESLSALEPADPTLLCDALCLAGELQLLKSRPVEALELLGRGRSLDPSSVACTAFYAAALGLSGKSDEALPLLESFTNTSQMTVTDLLPLGKAYVVLGDDLKGEQLLKSAWARGGDPYELGAAQVGKYLKLRSADVVGEAVDGYKQAVENLRNAARVNRKDPRPKYRLGLMMEEPYHHQLLYGGKKDKVAGEGDDSAGIAAEVQEAAFRTWSASAMEEEIAAIGQMHGCWGTPTIQELLCALLTEHRAAVDKGDGSADTVMVLYNFKARQLVASGAKGGAHLQVDANLKAAAKEYEECVRDNAVPEVLLHLARVQKLMGYAEKAAATAVKAAGLDPEHHGAAMYAAFLAQPVDLDGGAPCPAPLMEAAEAVVKCVDLAVEAGPEITGMLLAENLLHGSNPELSVAAVAVARGFNAAGKHAEAEALTRKLMALLPKTMAGIHWASVLQVELRGLFANAQEELLKALQARNAREEGMAAYEQLYAAVAEAQVSANKSLPALDRLLQCCRFGRSFRPQSSEVAVRLADALWMRVDADNEYEKKDNRQKKLDTLHEVECLLRESIALEGKPVFDGPASCNPPAAPPTPEKELPTELAKPEAAAKPAPPSKMPAAKPAPPSKMPAAKPAPPSKTPAAKPGISKLISTVKAAAPAKTSTTAAKPAVSRPAVTSKTAVKAAPVRAAAAKAAPTKAVVAAGKAAGEKAAVAAKPGAAVKPAAAAAPVKAEAKAAPVTPKPPPVPVNSKSVKARVDLARVMREVATMSNSTDAIRDECIQLYTEARDIDHRNVDASVGIGQLLSAQDPMKAVEEMAKFPDPEGCGTPEGTYGKPTFDDSFVHVEIARTLIKYATDTKDKALLESEQVEKSLSIAGKVMGWEGIEKWVEVLDNRGKWDMLKRIYLACNEDKGIDAEMAKGYFTAKGWDPVVVPRRYDVINVKSS